MFMLLIAFYVWSAALGAEDKNTAQNRLFPYA